jgi:hypothetical protein
VFVVVVVVLVVFVRETAYWRNDSSVEINKSKTSKAENAKNCSVERQTALVKRVIKFIFYFLSNSIPILVTNGALICVTNTLII